MMASTGRTAKDVAHSRSAKGRPQENQGALRWQFLQPIDSPTVYRALFFQCIVQSSPSKQRGTQKLDPCDVHFSKRAERWFCVSDISGAYTSHLDWLRHRPIEVSSSVMICRSWATPPASPPKVTSSKKPILNSDVRVCSTGCNGRLNSRGPNGSPCWRPIPMLVTDDQT